MGQRGSPLCCGKFTVAPHCLCYTCVCYSCCGLPIIPDLTWTCADNCWMSAGTYTRKTPTHHPRSYARSYTRSYPLPYHHRHLPPPPTATAYPTAHPTPIAYPTLTAYRTTYLTTYPTAYRHHHPIPPAPLPLKASAR